MGKKNRKSDGQRDPKLREDRRRRRLAEVTVKEDGVLEGHILTQEELRKKGTRREPRDFRDVPGVGKVEVVDVAGHRSPRERIEEKRAARHLPDPEEIFAVSPPKEGFSFLKAGMIGSVIIVAMFVAFFFIGCTERRTTIVQAAEPDSCGATCLTSSECDEIVVLALFRLGREHDEEICNLLAAVHECLQIKQPKKAVECAQMVIDDAVLKRLDP